MQRVRCKECEIGKFIFENNLKDKLEDLCECKMVYLLAKFIEPIIDEYKKAVQEAKKG